jgi:membrane fusion protein (multidrug efflux system)
MPCEREGQFTVQVGVERSKAAKTLSALQLARAEELLGKQAGTVAARDQAGAQDQQAHAGVMADEATLTIAKINLGYADILSPITGKVGRTNITKGNVVDPTSGPLTLIVSQDPMYVTFPVSERDVLEARRQGDNVGSIKVKLRFSDGSIYDQTGDINFVDVTVDRSTDSVTLRGTIPNPKGTLIDGQLVRVMLQSGTPEEKVVVPQSALIADQEGVYVFIDDNGKAAVRRLKLGDESGTDVVVESGLSGGELVIVEGLQGIRPGVPVRASPMPAAPGRS